MGRRGGDLLIGTLLDDLHCDKAVLQISIRCHLAVEGRGQIVDIALRLPQQKGHLYRVVDVDGLLAGGTVGRFREPLRVRHEKKRHLPAHYARAARRFDQQLARLVTDPGVQLPERRQFPVPDSHHRLVVVADAQGPLAHGVHIGSDAPGHAAKELLGLAHGLLLTLPLLRQGKDQHLLLLHTQVQEGAAGVVMAFICPVTIAEGVLAMEGFGDGRSD